MSAQTTPETGSAAYLAALLAAIQAELAELAREAHDRTTTREKDRTRD